MLLLITCTIFASPMNRQEQDLLAHLRQTLDQHGLDILHFLEDFVPVNEQTEYFQYTERLRRDDPPFERTEEVTRLFSPDASIEEKKRSLALLASIPDVEAYRAIETYHSSPQEPELQNWASMSLVSSRIVLNAELSGQPQLYISSGLGGRDKKLRFFALFTAENEAIPFTPLQRDIIEREFDFQLKHAGVAVEKFEIRDNYFTALLLFPFSCDIRATLKAAVVECNNYGNFIDGSFLVTNIKELSEEDITKIMKAEK